MFDLFRSQRKIVKYVLTFLLSMVALSMVVTMIPNLFSGQPNDLNDPVLVEVGDEAVTITEVYAGLREYGRAGTPPDAMAYMAQQIISNLIEEKVLLQEADRLGVKPSDAELANHLKDQMAFLWQGGQFNSAQYQQLVTQRFNLSVPEFEKNVLKDLTIELRLHDLVTDNIVLSEADLHEAYQDRNEMAQIRYVLVDSKDFVSQVPIDDDKVAAYFESNQLRYRVPEKRVAKVLVLNQASVPPMEFTEAQLQAFYNQNRERFETPERIFTRHILLMITNPDTGESLSEEEIQAKEARANEVAEKLEAGADFAALAAEYSEDAGTSAKGGELGWVVRGQYGDPALDKAAFALQAGEHSGVVRSDFGFHIIQVDNRDRAQVKSLDDVRAEIISDLSAEREQSARLQQVDKAIRAMSRPGDELEAAAAEIGVPVRTYGPFDRTNPPPDLSSMPVFFGNLMSGQAGEPVSYDHENTTYVGVISEIIPPRDPELAEVAPRVRQDYVNAEARKLAQAQAEELLSVARESDLAQAARRLGLGVETSDYFKRAGSVEGFTSARTIGNPAFDQPVGSVHGPISVGDRIGVYEVAGHAEADMAGFTVQRDTLRSERLQALRDETFGIFRSQAVRTYEDAGKIKRFDERITQVLREIRRG